MLSILDTTARRETISSLVPREAGSPRAAGASSERFSGSARRKAGPRWLAGLRWHSKRLLDIAGALIGIVSCAAIILICAALIKATSPGPVFISQTRIGWRGRAFRMWKLRSMKVDSDRLLIHYLAANASMREEWARGRKLQNDPRITWVGRFLRRYSLDELPQLWNVLSGDMSLVGPRPIQKDEIGRYADKYQAYCSVRPGLTGLWQVSGRNDTSYERRVQLDERYSQNWNTTLDLIILAKTIGVVTRGKGAY